MIKGKILEASDEQLKDFLSGLVMKHPLLSDLVAASKERGWSPFKLTFLMFIVLLGENRRLKERLKNGTTSDGIQQESV